MAEKSKKNLFKYIVAFLAGIVVTAIILLATTGEFFTGYVFKKTAYKPQKIVTVPSSPLVQEAIKYEKMKDELFNLWSSYIDFTQQYQGYISEDMQDPTSSKRVQFESDLNSLINELNGFIQTYNNITQSYLDTLQDVHDQTVVALSIYSQYVDDNPQSWNSNQDSFYYQYFRGFNIDLMNVLFALLSP